MIDAYNDYYLSIASASLGEMFEIAYYQEHLDLNDFFAKFLESEICRGFEVGDPVIVAGKSSGELIKTILNIELKSHELNELVSPEYWVGYTLAIVQNKLNVSFKELVDKIDCNELLNLYFPYHEMDESNIIELYKDKLNKQSTLKVIREQRNLSQNELAVLSGVPVRSIRAYEQQKVELSKASGEVLYALSRTLGCSIEKLIL